SERRSFTSEEVARIRDELRETALRVISKKGATIYAPASNTADVIQAIVRNEKRLFVCSVVLDGEYGLKDVSIGVPVIIGRGGVEDVIEWSLDKDEEEIFRRGAERLRNVIGSLEVT
ncbi:malate dehydrogenase, partial [Candidatus Bathyarchaeota archaeon]